MRSDPATSKLYFFCRLSACCICLATMAASARAQLSGPQPADLRPAVTDPKAATRERQEREAMLRNSEIPARAPTDERAAKAAAEQIKQDFKQIQVHRNNIARHLLAGTDLDLKLVADEAKEVHKRATRLKTYLMPNGEVAGKEGEQAGTSTLQDSLVTLCRHIDSFTENPVFKTVGVLDMDQSARAGSDLQTIILLSNRIKQDAERLKKTQD